ncbi:MAG: nucleotidyl transferase AbiEii/AbiGii toxin family protein [Elusimicrobia bacterium]|nr:nucleotidyl transferase AbiEii/AbiGii toxin family protein [Elusimicrobiota bacterium]
MYTQLQLTEIFHIEFLRYLAADLPSGLWALKGGVNLRLFFKSIRYSEDMDLDVKELPVKSVQHRVMRILASPSFRENLKTYGINAIKPPDIIKAKQTATTQRFKIHIMTSSGEDYFTKVEFSRRGFQGGPVAEPVPAVVLRPYGMAPLIAWHYPAAIAAAQKISAVLSRSILQARDIFDLYQLSTQVRSGAAGVPLPDKEDLSRAKEKIFEPGFEIFRDSVAAYLAPEDRKIYSVPSVWDEIKLKAADFVDELKKNNG